MRLQVKLSPWKERNLIKVTQLMEASSGLMTSYLMIPRKRTRRMMMSKRRKDTMRKRKKQRELMSSNRSTMMTKKMIMYN